MEARLMATHSHINTWKRFPSWSTRKMHSATATGPGKSIRDLVGNFAFILPDYVEMPRGIIACLAREVPIVRMIGIKL